MKVIVSKSKEYKKFTDLFYKNADAKNFKTALSKAYNNVTFQSGYTEMPDDYISNIPEIFEANSNIVDEKLTKHYTEVELPANATFRDKARKVMSDKTLILDNCAYEFRENSPEVLYGLGYFEPETKLAGMGTKDPKEIEPIQVITPAPLFVNYRDASKDVPGGLVNDIAQYQILVNSPVTGLINRNTSAQDANEDSFFYIEKIKQIDSGTGPVQNQSDNFIWAKTTKLDRLDVAGLPFNPLKRVNQIDLYKINELRSASVYKNNSYYAVKDDTTGEVYKFINDLGEEYKGPEIEIIENIYNNTTLNSKAQTYEIRVKIGTKVLAVSDIAADVAVYDELKNKFLEKRKKFGDLTYDESKKNSDFENVNKLSVDQSIYSGFSKDAIITQDNGSSFYDANKIHDELVANLSVGSYVIVGKKLYSVTGSLSDIHYGLADINVPASLGSVFKVFKAPLIVDSAFPIFINKVTTDVNGDTVSLRLVTTKDRLIDINLKLVPNVDVNLNQYDIMADYALNKLIEIELDGNANKVNLAENEYHVCSSITLLHELTIAGKEGTADVSSTVAMRSFEGKNFNNDGNVIIENLDLNANI